MSRAFVNEDTLVDDLPDRPISTHSNFVTPQGLTAIEEALAIAKRTFADAQVAGNRDGLSKAARDLRYWTARRASAEVVNPDPNANAARFGSTVTFVRGDGRRQTFQIVGEDEADPAKGKISYVSPLAKGLLGTSVGDVVQVAGDEVEVAAVR